MARLSSKKVHSKNKRTFYDTLDFLVLLFLRGTVRTRRELADEMNMQASTMSGCINRLLRRGYVKEVAHDTCTVTGNRVAVVGTTVEGDAIIKEAP